MRNKPALIAILAGLAFLTFLAVWGLQQSGGDIRNNPANPSGQQAQ